MECKGFLFDLDANLLDSLPAVERAWVNWAVAHNIEPQEVLDFIHGKQVITSLRNFLQVKSEAEIQREFDELERTEASDTQGVQTIPGASQLLERLNALGIPWAIVTSGTVPIAHARHRAGQLPQLQAFITAEQVARGKPQPDAYLLGAASLGLEPHECVVVEDAPAGLEAGCQVIAVNAPADTLAVEDVDMVLTSLTQLTLTPTPIGAQVSKLTD